MTTLSSFFRLAGALMLSCLISSSAAAEQWGADDQAELKRIISSQISAFRSDDAATAYSFASPGVQGKFTSSTMFMSMVRAAYPAIYRAQSFSFKGLSKELGDPTQRVELVGPNGESWLALYGFQRQPDGSWRISAVLITKAPGAAA